MTPTNTLVFSAQQLTKSLAVTATASSSVALPNQGSRVRIVNEGPNIVFVAIGPNAQVATLPSATQPQLTSTPVLAGTDVILALENDGVCQISAICRASGTATLSLQVGEGA